MTASELLGLAGAAIGGIALLGMLACSAALLAMKHKAVHRD